MTFQGADVHCPDGRKTDLIRRHVKTKNVKLISMLLDHGAHVDATDDIGYTNLTRAVNDNSLEIAT